MELREITTYEREKWFDNHNKFNAPTFLPVGDELGDAYNEMTDLVGSYGSHISNGLREHLQIEMLDMYYYQIHMYTGEYGGADEPERDFGLPPIEDFVAKLLELGVPGDAEIPASVALFSDEMRKAWDWAMDWRQEHIMEFWNKSRREKLERELETLK